MRLYALLDRKAAAYSSFHCDRSDAVACRAFADAVNAPDSTLGKYPQDFALVVLAEVRETVGDDELPVDGYVPYEILTAEQVVSLRKV